MRSIAIGMKPKVPPGFSVYAVALVMLSVVPRALSAQRSISVTPFVTPSRRLTLVGSAADDSMQLGALIGAPWGGTSLVRSSLSLSYLKEDSERFSILPIDP